VSDRFQVSAVTVAAEAASLIKKEAEVSCDLDSIRLRAQGVCMRFNLILFVLEIRILSRTKDE
jgi:hypothetical protein